MDSSEVEWNPRTDAGTTKYELFSMNKFNFVWEINNLHMEALRDMDYVLSSPLFPSEEKIFEFTIKRSNAYPKWFVIFKGKERPISTKYTISFLTKDDIELHKSTGFFIFTEQLNKIEGNASYRLNEPLFEGNFYLKVIVNMEVRKYTDTGPLLVKDPRSNLSEDYNRLFEKKSGCDVTFLVGEKEFQAHKLVLTTRSKVFASMFDSDFKESELKKVKIEDIEPEDFEEFLRFLYSEKADIDKYALGLLKAADKYDVSNLKGICEEELLKSLTEDNCLEILVEADLRLAKRLKEKAMEVLISNKLFMESQEWKNFKKVHRDLADEVYDFALGNLHTKEN